MKRQGINTENYEEYFLLYVDNELSAAEKAEVEQFASLNPELGEELQMLMDTKLTGEPIRMNGKENLFRTEPVAGINPENIEEWQVLLIDNELDASQAAAVEAYSASRDREAQNLEWLKKAKLSPEVIPFPDKSLLYRQSERTGTLISITWYRMAAAAAVILVAGLLWMNRPAEDELVPNRPAVAQKGTDSVKNRDEKGNPTGTDNRDMKAPEVQVALTGNETVKESGKKETGSEMPARRVNAPRENTGNKTYAAILPAPENKTVEPGISPDRNEIHADAQVTHEPLNTSPEILARQASVTNLKAEETVKDNYASDALYRETNLDEGNTVTDDGKPTRKGFRGIIRKANRFYNKVTNPDPDRPLVKVANFEIGLPR